MRRAIITLTVMCFTLVAEASGQVTLGLKAGFNLSDLDVNNAAGEDVDWKSKSAFTFGGYLQFGLGDVFAVQPEVFYSPKGARRNLDNGTVTLDLTYVDVPLLLMARIPAGDSPIWPILYVGPVISFETGCTFKGGGVSIDCDAGDTPTSRTDATDLGGTAGLGLEFFFGSIRSQLDARYTVGFSDITDSETEATVRNRGWAFLLGLGYALSP